MDNDNNRQNFLILFDIVINKEFSLIDAALIDSSANMNYIQEGLITFKNYERLTQILKILNIYKLPNVHICNDSIRFDVVKNLFSKVVLRNSFMDLLYPFLETGEGIKTNVTNLFFNFILPLIPKEIYSLNNVTIYRSERSLSSLKTEISLDDQLTEMTQRNLNKI